MENINLEKICRASNILANTIYKLATNRSNIQVNCTLITEIADCLLNDNNCKMKQEFNIAKSSKPSHYAGVFRWRQHIENTPMFIYSFMAKLTQLKQVEDPKSCDIMDETSCDPVNF